MEESKPSPLQCMFKQKPKLQQSNEIIEFTDDTAVTDDVQPVKSAALDSFMKVIGIYCYKCTFLLFYIRTFQGYLCDTHAYVGTHVNTVIQTFITYRNKTFSLVNLGFSNV